MARPVPRPRLEPATAAVAGARPLARRTSRRVAASGLGGLVLALASACVPTAAIEPGHPLTEQIQRGIATGTGHFDHAILDRLLAKHVTPEGRVDYAALAKDRKDLRAYLDRVAAAPLAKLGKAELLALLINTYNAVTLELILEHYPLASIRDLRDPWKRKICRLGGSVVSLDFVEHKLLRVPKLFGDPRVHFAVNCASIGCPPLRRGAFTAQGSDRQLDDAVRRALREDRHLRVAGKRVEVTAILIWFKGDFVRAHGSVAAFLRRYVDGPARLLLEGGDSVLAAQEYDWSLNDVPRQRK